MALAENDFEEMKKRVFNAYKSETPILEKYREYARRLKNDYNNKNTKGVIEEIYKRSYPRAFAEGIKNVVLHKYNRIRKNNLFSNKNNSKRRTK